MTIPKPEEEQSISSIPQRVTEIPQPEEAPEAKPLLISFERYNRGECQLDGMNPKMAKKALRVVRDVGVNIKAEDDFKKCLPKLEITPINNSGNYRKLYKGLFDLPDAEIKEAKIDYDKGRLFFFLIDRVFYVVAIRESHY
ncbi:MAG: hypothetical protein Q8Q95_02510 [bacterium]|nr:hypothetical protein [bacterium]